MKKGGEHGGGRRHYFWSGGSCRTQTCHLRSRHAAEASDNRRTGLLGSCKRSLGSQCVGPAQRSESSTRSPRHELPQVVTKVAGQQIPDKLTGGRERRARRRVGILPCQQLWVDVRNGIAQVSVHGPKCLAETTHLGVVVWQNRWLTPRVEQAAPLCWTQRGSATEPAAKVSGDGEVPNQPSGRLRASLWLERPMTIVESGKDRLRKRKQMAALENIRSHVDLEGRSV